MFYVGNFIFILNRTNTLDGLYFLSFVSYTFFREKRPRSIIKIHHKYRAPQIFWSFSCFLACLEMQKCCYCREKTYQWSHDPHKADLLLDYWMVYFPDKGGKWRGADAGAKLLERVANEVYRSSQVWIHGVLRVGGWIWSLQDWRSLLRFFPCEELRIAHISAIFIGFPFLSLI